MAIPEAARSGFKGRTAIVESLETSDIRVAMERRDIKERAALDLFKAIKAGEAVTREQMDAAYRGALVRENIKALQEADDRDALYDAVNSAEDEADGYRGKERKLEVRMAPLRKLVCKRRRYSQSPLSLPLGFCYSSGPSQVSIC
jgi:hypothetical protein